MEEDDSRFVLRWRWGSRDNNHVCVAGEFSKWERWPMLFVPGIDEHRLSLPRKFFPASAREVQYKFVVDGLWTCDGSLPMTDDGAGNVNNVLTLRRVFTSKSNGVRHRGPRIPVRSTSLGHLGHKMKGAVNGGAPVPVHHVHSSSERLPPLSSSSNRIR